jgi:hypothetical protein
MQNALPIMVMAHRSEQVLVATGEWRARAKAAFTARGRGSQSQCAADIHCATATITQILNGHIAASEHVGAISEWLHIAGPTAFVHNASDVKALELFQKLHEEQQELALQLLRQLAKQSEK